MYLYPKGYCPRFPTVDRRPGFDYGYSTSGSKLTYVEGKRFCQNKGATMPIMERYSYAEDIADFLGTRVNGNQGETSIWLGNETICPKFEYGCLINICIH